MPEQPKQQPSTSTRPSNSKTNRVSPVSRAIQRAILAGTPAAIGSGTQSRLGSLDSSVATIAASRALIPMATASQ
jgi:hypothetical protein